MPGSSFCKQKVGASDTKLAPTMVRVVGLEPTRLTAQEPKSCVSTNSTIPAYSICPLFLLGEGIPGAERCA